MEFERRKYYNTIEGSGVRRKIGRQKPILTIIDLMINDMGNN